MEYLATILVGISTLIGGWFAPAPIQLGAFGDPFLSRQVATTSLSSGLFLTTDGLNSYWASPGGGGSFPFTPTSWGNSTSTVIGNTLGFFGNGSSTFNILKSQHATSTNLDITGLLTFNGVTGATWASFCTTITGSADLCDSNDATGAGGAFPYTPATNWNATSTIILFNQGIMAMSSSSINRFDAVSGTTTNATSTYSYTGTHLRSAGTLQVDNLTSALTLTGSTGVFAEYTGTTCTNQFVRVLSALGVATCASIQDEDINLSDVTLADFTNDAGFTTFGWPFTPATSWNSTSTTLVLTNGLVSLASSSINRYDAVSGTTTNATSTYGDFSTHLRSEGSTRLDNMTSAILLTGSTGVVAEYAGTSCTNQALTALSALGASTCNTITSAYVDSSIATFGWPFTPAASWNATSTVIRNTLGFMGNSSSTLHILNNTYASSTYLTADTATTTNFFGAMLRNCSSNNVLTWSNGQFGCEADDQGSGSTDVVLWANATTSLWRVANIISNGSSSIPALDVVIGTTTNATSTSLAVSSVFSFGGVAGDAWTDFCTTITGGSGLCDGDDASGGGGSFPFTPTNYAGVLVNATTTPIWLKTGLPSLIATSTFATYSSSTQLSVSGAVDLDTFTSAILLTGAGGDVAEYGGAGCTNQLVEDIDAVGATTCRTVTSAYVDSTIATFGWPWTPATSWNATSTTLLLNQGVMALASSTIFRYDSSMGTTTSATSTTLSVSGHLRSEGTTRLDNMTSAILLTGSTGVVAEYAGASCTNQAVTALSALGAATCTTLTSAYVDSTIMTKDNNKWATTTGTLLGITPAGANFVGIGTTTPRSLLHLATSTAPQLTLSDLFASNDSYSLRSIAGAFYLSTSSMQAQATSTTPVLWSDTNGVVSFGNKINTCIALTGSAGLCDGSDDGGGGADYNKWATTTGTFLGITPTTAVVVGLGTSTPRALLHLATTSSTELLFSDGYSTSYGYSFGASPDAFYISTSNPSTVATSTTALISFNRTTGGVTIPQSLTTGSLTLTQPLTVANGGTGIGTLTGILIGNGTSAFTADAVPLNVSNGGTGLTTFGGTNTVLYTTAADTLASEAALTYDPALNLFTSSYASSTYLSTVQASSTFASTSYASFDKAASTTNLTISGITTASTQCLQISSTGAVSGTNSACSTITGVANSKWATTSVASQVQSIGTAGAPFVGIGTSSPRWPLTIASGTVPQLTLADGTLTQNPFNFRAINSTLYLSTSSPSTFATATLPILTIDSAGQAALFVATTSNSNASLAVAGKVFISGLTSSTAGNAVCQLTSNEVVNAGNTTCITSSIKTKHNIEDITSEQASEILRLSPKQYVNNEGGDTRYGFIADEIVLIDPTLVEFAKSDIHLFDGQVIKKGEPSGVDYLRGWALLTKFTQDFYQEFQSLMAKVTGLEERIEDNEKMIKLLEDRLDKLEVK